MTIIEEILSALLLSQPEDLRVIHQYIGWMKIRRAVNNRFYLSGHWVGVPRRHHWLEE
jgi:hypothetical protein